MTSNEWLPPQIPFEIVRRGYAPDQVTAHLEKLEYDLRIATANRDATNQRLTELAAQLSAAQNDADNLRRQLDRMALEPISMTSLSDRMQRMIRIAEEEAAETKAKADTYAADLAERAEREASDLKARTEAESAAQLASMQAKQANLDAAKAAFDVERDRARTQLADQIRDLIAEATAEAEATKARAREEAEATTSAATAAAAQAIAEARAEVERLDAESTARRAEAEEDFTLALNARRTESHRLINEQEQRSIADSAARVDAATAHAAATVASANEHAATVIARAAAESHQRVADADAAVGSLTDLRSELLGQLGVLGAHLDQVRTMVAQGGPMLAPPEQEAGRARTEQFPEDPAARQTDPPGFDPEPPAWAPPEQQPFIPFGSEESDSLADAAVGAADPGSGDEDPDAGAADGTAAQPGDGSEEPVSIDNSSSDTVEASAGPDAITEPDADAASTQADHRPADPPADPDDESDETEAASKARVPAGRRR
jgi:cell division septum initiation protein DivIVA